MRLLLQLVFVTVILAGTALASNKPRDIDEATFDGTWPFTVTRGAISCVSSGAVLFQADGGMVYAVNGHAEAMFKGLPDIEAIWKPDPTNPALRVNIGDIINYGLELCNGEAEVANEVRSNQPEQPMSNDALDYEYINAKLKSFYKAKGDKTSVQKKALDEAREAYVQELLGQTVTWQGWIHNVKPHGNAFKVFIDMHAPSKLFSVYDVYFYTPDPNAAHLAVDMYALINARIKDIDSAGTIELELITLDYGVGAPE